MTQLAIVSGGQTGVDRAALDVAIAKELPRFGWCPLGGIAEDLQIDRTDIAYKVQPASDPQRYG